MYCIINPSPSDSQNIIKLNIFQQFQCVYSVLPNPSTMKFCVAVLLSCLLVPEVLSIICQQCISTLNNPCPNTPVNCSNVCSSATLSTYISSTNVTTVATIQNCTTSSTCINGSVNFGSSTTAINSQCCSTDNCNNQTMPAPQPQLTNGMSCFTCNNANCTIAGTVNCTGDQNRCFTVYAAVGNNTSILEGCASKSFCDTSFSNAQVAGLVNVTCCQGNLCNNAVSVTLNVITIILFLLCSIIFI